MHPNFPYNYDSNNLHNFHHNFDHNYISNSFQYSHQNWIIWTFPYQGLLIWSSIIVGERTDRQHLTLKFAHNYLKNPKFRTMFLEKTQHYKVHGKILNTFLLQGTFK